MSGRRAKAIRRQVYGDLSIRDRDYYKLERGTIIADRVRRAYQQAKCAWKSS